MGKISLRKRIFTSKLAAIFFALLSIFLLCFFLFLLFLPRLIENQAKSLLDKFCSEDIFVLQIKHIGLFQTEFSLHSREEIFVDGSSAPSLELGSCSISYFPLQLFKKRLEKIELSGITLNVDLTPDKPLLPFLEAFTPAETDSAKETSVSNETFTLPKDLPVGIKQLRLSGTVLLTTEDEFIPVDFTAALLSVEETNVCNWNYQLSLRNSRNRFVTRGNCNFITAELKGEIESRLHADSLPYSIRKFFPKELSLFLDGKCKFSYDLQDLDLSELSAEFDSSLLYQPEQLFVHGSPQINLQLTDKKLTCQLSDLSAISAGFNFDLQDLQVEYSLLEKNDLRAKFQLAAGCGTLAEFIGECSFLTDEKRLLFILDQQSATQQNEFAFPKTDFSLLFEVFNLQGFVDFAKELTYEADAVLKNVNLKDIEIDNKLEEFKLNVVGTLKETIFSASAKQVLAASAELFSSEIPELICQGNWQNDELSAKISLQKAKVTIDSAELNFITNAELPIKWPAPEENAEKGYLNINFLEGKIINDGELKGDFFFEKNALFLQLNSDILALQASLNAEAILFDPENELSFKAKLIFPEQSLPSNFLLNELLSDIDGWHYDAKISAEGEFSWQKNKPTGSLSLKLFDGILEHSESNFSLKGLRIHLNLPDLPKLSSDGNQLLAFRSINFDKIAVNAGRIRFRMESPSAWHLEDLTMNWCEGKLRLDSTRFNPDTERYRLVFHCDHLKLSSLLQQLGIGNDQGEGRISGSIPVMISKDEIRFRDAFLYSTPGENGSIKMLANESISAAAAASDQLSFALDALQDFDYSWVKLNLSSEKEMLRVALQTDGKPVNRLYYIPKDGSLVKSEVANEFQGLNLNANLNIPLTNTLKTYKQMQKIFNP